MEKFTEAENARRSGGASYSPQKWTPSPDRQCGGRLRASDDSVGNTPAGGIPLFATVDETVTREIVTTEQHPYDFDFAVAGGGPGGSSAAISLALRGHRVVLFEAAKFPRFHTGESLISTVNDSLRALGLDESLEAAGFPKKWGARLMTHDGASGRNVDFVAARGITKAQTYQVNRAGFDQILLDRAREVGVDVRECHRVLGCNFDAESATLQVVDEGRADQQTATPFPVRVRAIVDATGQAGLLARKFTLRKVEPALTNIAIFSHYSGVPRLEGDRPDDLRLIARADAGWFWTIPISDQLTSVGVVMPKNLFQRLASGSNEERLERAIADTPVVAELLSQATRQWPVRAEKDFSYSAKAYAGERWILVGDAGAFLDPVFSTGVSIAMESGIEAAEALDRALANDDFSVDGFRDFSVRQNERFQVFRRFVLGFYTPEFRDRFFDPTPPAAIFRSVVTVLAGNWKPDLRTRLLNRLFFLSIALQRRFPRSRLRFRRDADAGYPTEP